MFRSASAARLRAFSAALVLGAAVALGAPDAAARGAPDSFADLAERLSPSVVNISSSQTLRRETQSDGPQPQFPPGSPLEDLFRDFMERNEGDAPRRVNSLGSGFVIDPAGFIVTNNHVIADADEITITFTDGSTLPAKVVGKDPKTDIALLKVEPKQPLPAVKFGNSDAARVGDWVLAIGNPFGLGGSVTAGIISARNRDIDAGPYDDFIQTDAPINRGNSGGPLFNMDGEVVGMNSAIYSPSGGSVGIGFAIPASLVQSVVQQLREFGETRRGWIGVRVQTVTEDLAQSLGLERPRGALIADVTPDGPAAKAGLQGGDVVVAFNGREVPDMRALPRMVAEAPVGATLPLEILRQGAPKTLSVTLGRLEEAEAAETQTAAADPQAQTGEPSTVAALGLSLAPLSDEARVQYKIEGGVSGVLVTSVAPDSPAAEKNLREGDVIVEVAQEPVSSPQQVAEKVDAFVKAERKVVLLLVNRGGEPSFVAVRVEPKS